jgi:hypothetical protein
MDIDEIREHIESAGRSSAEGRMLMTLIIGACWPGGAEDRTEPAARRWLKRWRPVRVAVAVPDCSCSSGRCPLCN